MFAYLYIVFVHIQNAAFLNRVMSLIHSSSYHQIVKGRFSICEKGDSPGLFLSFQNKFLVFRTGLYVVYAFKLLFMQQNIMVVYQNLWQNLSGKYSLYP